MFDNDEWSDLKVQTATYTFNVNKSVVCLTCPFFKAACTGDWKEARAGIIELPESAETVEQLLQWCYGVFDTDYFTGSAEKLRYYELLVAADKVCGWSHYFPGIMRTDVETVPTAQPQTRS